MGGNLNFDDPRNQSASTGYHSPSSSQSPPSQFVPNAAGVGQRSVQKRSTFKRTNRVDASTEDLLHDPHQQQHQQQFTEPYPGHSPQEYGHPSSNLHAPQQIRHPDGLRPNASSYVPFNNAGHSGIRPPLIHGAHESRNSSGHDSGLSSGGTSFDPEQYYMRNLGNQNHPTIPMTSVAPSVDVYDVPPPIPIPRRKSLPSIVKTLPGDYKIDETARSNDHLSGNETFIIENGIRKRVTEYAAAMYSESGTPLPQATVMTSSSGSPALARRIVLESIQRVDALTSAMNSTGGNKRTSMPTLVNVARQRQVAPSRCRTTISSIWFPRLRRHIKRRSNCSRLSTARRIAPSTRSRFHDHWTRENLATGMKWRLRRSVTCMSSRRR